MKIATILLTAALATACVSNRTALNQSHYNFVWMHQVKLGQTAAEVAKIMKHPPESHDVKSLPDGTIEESWNYLTDYNSDTNTTLVFRAGVLVEINQTHWLGNGTFPQ